MARTETFEHTISGLLQKRADLLGEAESIRDRLAEIKNDVSAVDRVLLTLGYTGDLDAQMPRQKRQVIFGRGELTRAVLGELRGRGRAGDQPRDCQSRCRGQRSRRSAPQVCLRTHQAGVKGSALASR